MWAAFLWKGKVEISERQKSHKGEKISYLARNLVTAFEILQNFEFIWGLSPALKRVVIFDFLKPQSFFRLLAFISEDECPSVAILKYFNALNFEVIGILYKKCICPALHQSTLVRVQAMCKVDRIVGFYTSRFLQISRFPDLLFLFGFRSIWIPSMWAIWIGSFSFGVSMLANRKL